MSMPLRHVSWLTSMTFETVKGQGAHQVIGRPPTCAEAGHLLKLRTLGYWERDESGNPEFLVHLRRETQ
jgi:hypothetical protein